MLNKKSKGSFFPKGKKGAGADLLLEIIVSSIIFFVIVIVIFGTQIPKQQLKANAHVISADAAVACEMSLTNLLRANSSLGITYNDWLVNEYVQGNNLSASSWKSNVTKLFSDTFSQDMWDLNITLPNGTTLLTFNNITKGIKEEVFICAYDVPFPAAYAQYFCFPNIPAFKDATEGGSPPTFKNVEGTETVKCAIHITADKIQIVKSSACNLDLEAKSAFEDNMDDFITNDATDGILESLTLPLLVRGAHYTITVNETVEGQKADVILAKRARLDDCALKVILRTTNVSAQS